MGCRCGFLARKADLWGALALCAVKTKWTQEPGTGVVVPGCSLWSASEDNDVDVEQVDSELDEVFDDAVPGSGVETRNLHTI